MIRDNSNFTRSQTQILDNIVATKKVNKPARYSVTTKKYRPTPDVPPSLLAASQSRNGREMNTMATSNISPLISKHKDSLYN